MDWHGRPVAHKSRGRRCLYGEGWETDPWLELRALGLYSVEPAVNRDRLYSLWVITLFWQMRLQAWL